MINSNTRGLVAQNPNAVVYQIPLSFNEGTTDKEVVITLGSFVAKLRFNLNTVEQNGDNLYFSCYNTDMTTIYFASYRCAFGTYLNQIDNGCPYVFFFLDNSANQYKTITFDAINNGVALYALKRT